MKPGPIIIMGNRYKKKFEREWEGKPISEIKIKMLKDQANKNITRICKGELVRRRLK